MSFSTSISQVEIHGHVRDIAHETCPGHNTHIVPESSTAEYGHSKMNVSRKHQNEWTFSSLHSQSKHTTTM